MKISLRLVLVLAVLCALVFLGLLNSSFVFENILRPLALTLWLLLRIFILSIAQGVIWGVVILAAAILFIYRFIQTGVSEGQTEIKGANAALANLEFWKTSMSARPYYPDRIADLRKKLSQVLVSIYASRKRVPANFQVLEAFKSGEIPLPPGVYSFLFKEETKRPWHAFQKWLERILGRDIAGHYRKLEECLRFLENFMEVKNERKPNE
jgi:hypothetical protein